MKPIHDTEVENRIGGNAKEGNLLVLTSGKITNTTEQNLYAICLIDIKIYDDNDPTPDKFPEHKQKNQGN